MGVLLFTEQDVGTLRLGNAIVVPPLVPSSVLKKLPEGLQPAIYYVIAPIGGYLVTKMMVANVGLLGDR